MTLSDRIRHFFHVVSNVRPIYWILLYLAVTPVFATIYWALPDGQFRIPDGGTADWGSWLYYSIVTITTLGFGDYTPALPWAQVVTAVEVMTGLVVLGFFLNAVGAMKSEIDVASEVEKQRRAHFKLEYDKLSACVAPVIHSLNLFLEFCYVVTTKVSDRDVDKSYNPDFKFSDMADLYNPSGLPADHTSLPAVERLLTVTSRTALCLDSLQSRVDLTLWPELLEESFSFVANSEMFASADEITAGNHQELRNGGDASQISKLIAATDIVPAKGEVPAGSPLTPYIELYYMIKNNAALALKIEAELTRIMDKSTPDD